MMWRLLAPLGPKPKPVALLCVALASSQSSTAPCEVISPPLTPYTHTLRCA